MPAQQKSKSGGSAKHGRKRKACEVYRLINQRLKNKLKKIRRHLRLKKGSKRKGTQVLRHANDKVAMAALQGLS